MALTTVSSPMPPRKPKVKKAPATKSSMTRDRPAAVALPGAAKPSAPAVMQQAPVVPARTVPTPAKQLYKALYNFTGQAGEINLTKGEQVEVKQKDDNGWWMVIKNGQEGWAPSN